MGFGEQRFLALLAACIIFEETRGEIICGRFRSINAQAERKRSKLRRTGFPSKIHNSTTLMTASGKVQTDEEAQVFVHDIELFVSVQILDNTLAVLSLGKLCEEHGYTCEWTSSRKPHLAKNVKRILPHLTKNRKIFFVQHGKLRSHCCHRILFKAEGKFVFHIVTAGLIQYLSESGKTAK